MRASPAHESRGLTEEARKAIREGTVTHIVEIVILVVNFFEHALVIQTPGALELLYLGGGIALIGLALYLAHASEEKKGHEPPTPDPR